MKSIILVFVPVFVLAVENEHRHQHAHEHGVGSLNIVVEGKSLQIEIDSPAHDIVGFETKPKTPKQTKVYAEALKKLELAENVMILPTDASCKPSATEFEKEDEHEAGHSDIGIKISWTCEKPEALKKLKVTLFEQFPSIKKLKLQMLINGKQPTGASEVTKTSPYVPDL